MAPDQHKSQMPAAADGTNRRCSDDNWEEPNSPEIESEIPAASTSPGFHPEESHISQSNDQQQSSSTSTLPVANNSPCPVKIVPAQQNLHQGQDSAETGHMGGQPLVESETRTQSSRPSQQSINGADNSDLDPLRPLWKIWGLETLSLIVGFLVFAGIIALLASHDQKQLPSWPLKISLNSVLAFLTTVAKAAFMWPVSNAISQAKWSWFLQDRPLYDFHLIDQASRGSWGSLALIRRIRHRHFITLAAVLSVICVLTSPLTQLSIDYRPRHVPSPDEKGAQTSVLGMLEHPVHENLDLVMSNAVSHLPWPAKGYDYGLINPTGAACPTGNCTFDTIHSLGVCVRFADISPKLEVRELDAHTTATLKASGEWLVDGMRTWKASIKNAYPDGTSFDLVHQGKFALVLDMLSGNQSIAFRADRNLMQTKIASLVLIRTAPVIRDEAHRRELLEEVPIGKIAEAVDEIKHEASEILFHLCVQSYNITVEKGEQTTTLVDSSAELRSDDSDFFMDFSCNDMAFEPLSCDAGPVSRPRYNDTVYLRNPPNRSAAEPERYGATYEAVEAMATEIKTLMMAYAQEYPGQFEGRPNLTAIELVAPGGSILSRPLWLSIFMDPENLVDSGRTYGRIQTLYSNIALSLSSGLRENQFRYRVTDSEDGIFSITGTAWIEESYVHVTWGWLAFLAVELTIATVFLAITIVVQIKTRAGHDSAVGAFVVEEFKDSSLAPLLALSPEARSAVGGRLQRLDFMKERAKRLHVRLEGSEIVPSEMRQTV
ncbi:hypothetical protein QBC40DRAFT_268560 [Triangularia verruculosa]|uniref:Uncharacterized protein n=1 Tax=Triangularia verruculosa TaxID=2587418 RepID=A0AAN7ARX3_9PEZI|nr:hypothetical protein QBC40DRAFT_268560 [Triangularia verruculosa]